MAFNPKDYYFKKAKRENFAARSVFKLEEIDQKFRLFKKGYKVLDLGASPGSWSQYASAAIGTQGRILGIDLKPITLSLPNAYFEVADINTANFEELCLRAQITPPFDLVISDMAPNTTGVKITDQVRSLELCEMALAVADKYLRERGHFVCKLFHSGEFEDFRRALRERFSRVELLKPKSTRKESKEIFFVGLQKKV